MPFFANPYVMAAFAAVAIGVAIYEILSRQEERPQSYGRSRNRRPPSPPSFPSPPPTPKFKKRKDSRNSDKRTRVFRNSSMTMGSEDSWSSSRQSEGYEDSRSSSRQSRGSEDSWSSSRQSKGYEDSRSSSRQSRGSENSWTSSRQSEYRMRTTSSEDSSTSSSGFRDPDIRCNDSSVRKRTVTVATNGPTEEKTQLVPYNPDQCDGQNVTSNIYSPNTNKTIYEEKVYEKILNDITSANIKPEKEQKLIKNILDEDSDSENNEEANMKLRNKDALDQPVSSSNDCNNLSQSGKTEEEIYKKKVLDILEGENISSQEAVGTSGDSNHVQQNKHIDANLERGICSGCEESPINAVAYPCGHSYLCSDCAKKIFKLYKKCAMCFADVQEFKFQSM